MPSKPQPAPQRPDDEREQPLDDETRRILEQRMATFEEDRKAARPADEVMERLLRRYPQP
jgi:hypothetical protein